MHTSLRLNQLARAILTGEHDEPSIVRRLENHFGTRGRWQLSLAHRYLQHFPTPPRPRLRSVVQFLSLLLTQDSSFRDAYQKSLRQTPIAQWLHDQPQRMAPAPAAANWKLPPIESPGELANWLRLTHEELAWFCGPRYSHRNRNRANASTSPLHHYHLKAILKRSAEIRLLETPKQRLKLLQRQLLNTILNRIPAHPAAHGFLRRRSIQTFAAPHVGQHTLLRMDVQHFFPTITAARVEALFRTAGYPEQVANLLSVLTTHRVPISAWKHLLQDPTPSERVHQLQSLYNIPHLPQGAPSSPAIANLCAYRLDCRLQGLAQSASAQYTRYADDLAFSGDQAFSRHAETFSHHVAAILLEEGFQAHHRKTRIQRQSVRQILTGLVINQHLNIPRPHYDQLKAILTNCIRLGTTGQNRDGMPDFQAHLSGRISFVESIHPARGERLRKLFQQIHW